MTKSSSPSASSQRARRRSDQARKKVILAALIAVMMAGGVLWISQSSDSPTPLKPAEAVPTFSPRATDDVVPIPTSDADLMLVNGEQAPVITLADLGNLPTVTIDLAVPVRLEGQDTFETRIMTEGRPMLTLEGRVLGEERNRLRIEAPTDWLIPGTYLFEFRTRERAALPLRRFVLMVETDPSKISAPPSRDAPPPS
ncbi:hypothetical protein MK280_03300 [Myxococcota bacterium]|nr:hypothetical protein [Myxococcota bacterium]